MPFGISTCSNHIERIHRTLNLKTSTFRSLSKRFAETINTINSYYNNYSVNSRRQVKKTLSKMEAEAKKFNYNKKITCDCGWEEIYTYRYGINNFPCIHTVLAKIKNIEIKNIDIPTISFNINNKYIQIEDIIQEWNFTEVEFNNVENYPKNIVDPVNEHIINWIFDIDEYQFLYQIANDILYLKKNMESREKILIDISIKWGQRIFNNVYIKHRYDFRSKFLIDILNEYSLTK